MGLFALNEEENTYTAEIDGIEFVCEEATPEFEQLTPALAQAYQNKIPKLIEFMMDEVTSVFGYMSEDELKEALGTPQIDLNREVISFLEHTLDDSHIIEVEYGGLFEEFYEVVIDG